jgi:hypothetical protein
LDAPLCRAEMLARCGAFFCFRKGVNVSIGLIFVLVGVILFVLDALHVNLSVGLFALGWAFVVAGALLVH